MDLSVNILITGRYIAVNQKSFLAVEENYIDAVARAGGNPYVGLRGNPSEMASRMDGIVFSGGVDLHPGCYGEEIAADGLEIDLRRDISELALFRAFVAQRKPVLGICRGMQLINVALGGSLWQDIQSVDGDRLPHVSGSPPHEIELCAESRLGGLLGRRCWVNTYHHQAARRIGRGLKVTARTRDGTVEAIEHTLLPIWGVQWHPERMAEGERIFIDYIETVKRCR